MAFCRKCGAQIDEEAVICPHCGVEQRIKPANNDDGSIGWAILGFLIPIVGLILWAVWHSDKPKSAKMAGIGALISVIIGVVFWIVLIGGAIAFGEWQAGTNVLM